MCYFISFSPNTGNDIDYEGATELSEALKVNTSLTSLDLSSNTLLVHLFSLNTDNPIDNEGANKLFEALKSNSTLNKLDLYRNILCFVSFSLKQKMALIMKEPSNYLKHSNQIHLFLNSFSAVTDLFHFILTPYRQ
jgi:hypothetical protein